jgi:hypothetical protein
MIMGIIKVQLLKGSSYRSEKRPTRIPSIRLKGPGPGQKTVNKTFIQAIAAGKGLFYCPNEYIPARKKLMEVINGMAD